MAKAQSKPSAVAAKKAAAKSRTAKPAVAKTKSVALDIEQSTEEALAKLKALNIEPGLQADIEWCLGSYRSDKNPIGLYDMISRAVTVFKAELQKKTKGVSSKLIGDLEKTLSGK